MSRPKVWSEDVENLYRFQLAGYRDEMEYRAFHQTEMVRKSLENGGKKRERDVVVWGKQGGEGRGRCWCWCEETIVEASFIAVHVCKSNVL